MNNDLLSDVEEQLAVEVHYLWNGHIRDLFKKGEWEANGSFVLLPKAAAEVQNLMKEYPSLTEEEQKLFRSEAEEMLIRLNKNGIL